MILEIKEISITDPAEAICELVRVLRAQGVIANTSEPEPEQDGWILCKDGAHIDVNDNECILVDDGSTNPTANPTVYSWGEGTYVISSYRYRIIKR